MELHVSESSDQVQLATRQQLFSLLAFLDKKLPDYCEVYGHVLTSLCSTDPIYKVFFLRDSNDGYRAVIGLQRDGRRNSRNEMQRAWLITAWAVDELTKLQVFKSIEDVNWQTDEFVFSGRKSEPHPIIAALFADHGRKLAVYQMDLYVIDRQEALNIELRARDGVYVKSLESHHAGTVYDNWAYREITTVDSVLDSVMASPSAGVFVKDSDQLVCWMTSRVHVGMSQLHTLEQFRHRGYAILATRYLSKRLAQSGYVPYAIVSPSNEPSVRCFKGVGFKSNGAFHICEVTFPDSG